MQQLHKATGPECPQCGCNACEIVGAGVGAAGPWARYACEHCGKEFGSQGAPAAGGTVNGVTYDPVNCRCPKCGTANPKVVSTKGRIRYHLCGNCGQNIKSVEKSSG